MRFRERDGVCVAYEVRGIEGSAAYPYVNDLPSLKEAVAIGRGYPDVYADGSATHIVRRYSKRFPPGHEFHHSSCYTHRWRVSSSGHLQLIVAYSREWPTDRMDIDKYARSLRPMPYPACTLRGQLADLAAIAKQMGLSNAAQALSDHVYGWRALAPFCADKMTFGAQPVPVSDAGSAAMSHDGTGRPNCTTRR